MEKNLSSAAEACCWPRKRDVDLKAYQEALNDCCPRQGNDQLELQEGEEEEGINRVNDEKNGKRENSEEEVRVNIEPITEEGFSPIGIPQLFEEPDSDSGLSLNSSHSTTSSDLSSYSVCSEGAVACSSNAKSVSLHGVGIDDGHCQKCTKYGHEEYQGDSECSREAVVQQLLHNLPYSQLPSQSVSLIKQMQMEKSNKGKARCRNSTDQNLSHDKCQAKPLRIQFSVNEVVSMPVNSFNSMLAKKHLIDTQVSLICNIRRRGKNNVAAPNCCKHKWDVILARCVTFKHKRRALRRSTFSVADHSA